MFHLTRPFTSYCSRFASSTTSASSGTNGNAVPSRTAAPLPPAPQDCCMSGCEKCVWHVYAEDLQQHLGGLGNTALAKAVECIEDPSLRMFIKMELKIK